MNGDTENAYLIPNALYGSFAFAAGPSGYRLQGRSPSFTDSLAERFETICKNIGTGNLTGFCQVPTVAGNQRQATLPGGKSPGATVPAKPGVMAVAVFPAGLDHAKRPATGFHGVFLNEDMFAAFDDQTYGLWRSGALMAGWDGNDDLPLLRITRDVARPPAISNLVRGQIDVLTHELAHLLGGGDVMYRFAQPNERSDEHLRMLQLGLPRNLRLNEGFATFLATSLHPRPTVRGQDSFAICAVAGTGNFDIGRCTRLPSRRRPEGSDEAIQAYVETYRQLLIGGDMAGLLRNARAGVADDPVSPGNSARRRKGLFSWFGR